MKFQKGAVAVEMAIVAPVMILVFLGIAQFGWLLLNSVAVANAASAGARYFAAQRGASAPYTSTVTQVQGAVSLLAASGLSVSTTVNGTTCSDDSSCASDLAAASSPAVNVGATVSVSYSSFKPIFSGSFFNLNTMMPSTLTSTVTERVQ